MWGKLFGLVFCFAFVYGDDIQIDCALEIGITHEFRACLKYYTAFQAEMSEEGLVKEGVIIPLLCSNESKRAIKCMMEYYFQCPDVIRNSANSRKLLKEFEATCLPSCTTEMGSTPAFRVNIEKYKMLKKAISQLSDENRNEICTDENMQTMVSLAFYLHECPTLQMYIGGTDTARRLSRTMFTQCAPETDLPSPKQKTCPSAMRCVLLLFSNYVQVFFAEVKTPYRKLQKQVGFVCGETNNAFKDCLRESLPSSGSCEIPVPRSQSTLGHVFSMSSARNQSVNGYLERECAAFPNDFAYNTCLIKNMDSAKFVLCLKGLEMEFQSAESRKSCEFHLSSLKCLQTHVTGTCGAVYYPAFQRAMQIFITDGPSKDCFTIEPVNPVIQPSSRATDLLPGVKLIHVLLAIAYSIVGFYPELTMLCLF